MIDRAELPVHRNSTLYGLRSMADIYSGPNRRTRHLTSGSGFVALMNALMDFSASLLFGSATVRSPHLQIWMISFGFTALFLVQHSA